MFHVLKDLKGLSIAALDHDVGEVKDVLFDDLTLTLRYLVVNTGSWLRGRDVLVSPLAIKEVHPDRGVVSSILTKREIEDSPPLETHLPVSRQYEEALAKHYAWTPYWGMSVDPGLGGYGTVIPTPEAEWHNLSEAERLRLERLRSGDPHLQSANEVEGYKLHATDGDVGHLKDYLVEEGSWRIKFLVVQTGHWLSRRKVVIDRAWIRNVEWSEGDIVVALTRREIENAPAYDPEKLGAKFESDLTVYYKGLFHQWQAKIRPKGGHRRGDDAARGM